MKKATSRGLKFIALLFLTICSIDLFAQCIAENNQLFTFCGSGSVTVHGHTYSPTTTTTYRDTLPGAAIGGCDSVIIIHISVSQAPAAPAQVSSFTVNDGDTVNPISFNFNGDTTIYASWRSSNATVGLIAPGAGSIPAFKAINNTNFPVIDTISVVSRSRGYAYLAADSFIIKFSLVEHRYVDTIYLPNGATGAAQVVESPADNVAYVMSYYFPPGSANAYKEIYVLDLSTDQFIRTLRYTHSSIQSTDKKGTMTISPDGSYLYIVGNRGHYNGSHLLKLDVRSGAYTDCYAVPNQGQTHGICISPDGRYVYMANTNNVKKVDVQTMTLANANINASLATQIVISADGKWLYAGVYGALKIINTANDSVVKTVALYRLGDVMAMSFTPDNRYLLVLSAEANTNSLTTSRIDLATNTLVPVGTNNGTGPFGSGFSWQYTVTDAHFPNISITPDGLEYYRYYTFNNFLSAIVNAPGGRGGGYGPGNTLGNPPGFGSVGDFMVPGFCKSPEMRFTITINPTMRYSQSLTICAGKSVTAAGHTYSAAGTYVDTLVNASMYGTDSIVTTQLTITPYPASYRAFTFCGSGNVTVGGIVHNTPGYYSDTLQSVSSQGCDSIVNTNLVIYPSPSSPSLTLNDQVVCAGNTVAAKLLGGLTGGNTIVWAGSNSSIGLAASGFTTVPTFISVNSGNTPQIDTIAVTTAYTGYAYISNPNFASVSVINRQTNTVAATIASVPGASGVSVSPNGSRVYVANQNVDRLTVINGITNTIMTTINVGGQPASVAVGTTGTRVYVANNASGTVSVIDTTTNTVTATIPVGTNPTAIVVNPNGKYAYVTNSGSNTVSVISTASNTVVGTINMAIAPQELAVNAAGNRLYVVSQAAGTVSIIDVFSNTVLNTVTVGSAPRGIALSFDGTRAYVANFLDNTVSVINTTSNTVITTIPVDIKPTGVAISADGTKVYTTNSTGSVSVIATSTNTVLTTITGLPSPNGIGNFTNGTGCQSPALKYTITINPKPHYTQQIDRCTGGSITVGTHTYNATGTYNDTLPNASINGCDSTITTQLTMHSPVTSTVAASICAGGSYAGHTAAGTYLDHYNTIYGCDSARTLTLTITSNITSTVNQTICQGASYAGHTTAGTYVDHYTAIGGCDSARTLILTVTPNVTSTVNYAVCQGSNYLGYYTAGTYVNHYTSAAGCDSARTLNLTITPNVTSTVNRTICQGASYMGYAAAGSYVDHYISAAGCDSARTLNLTITPNVTSTVNKTICQGSSYLGYNANGIYVDHYTSARGCDSARTLNLTVTPNVTSTVNQTICQGASYLGYNVAGSYVDHYTAIGGCDSARTLILNVTPNVTSTVSKTICQGASYLGYTAAGIYIDHYTSAAGCDSARTLNLTITPNVTSTVNYTICQGASYLGYTAAGIYIDHYTSATACDSARTLNLTVTPNVTSIVNHAICQGSSYLGYTVAGTYVDHYNSAAGCDSARTLNLAVAASINTTVTETICQGSTYAGHDTSGIYIDHFTAVGGCDSVRTLTLTVTPNVTSTINQTICQGASYEGYSITGTFVDHFTSAAGCDSARTLNLVVNAPSSSSNSISICSSALPYTWNGLVFTAAGSQTKTGLTNAAGCDSTATLSLTVNVTDTSMSALTVCAADLPYIWNSLTFTAAGSQTATGLTGTDGCDSAATLALTISNVDDSASVNGAVCTAHQAGATYQWINCATDQPIAGAISQSYTATQSGSYKCLVIAGSCMDTTICVPVINIGIADVKTYHFELYPNPTSGSFTVEHNYHGALRVQIISTLGNVVREYRLTNSIQQLDIDDLAAGMYYVIISAQDVQKVVKE